jgi:hypothetical protein
MASFFSDAFSDTGISMFSPAVPRHLHDHQLVKVSQEWQPKYQTSCKFDGSHQDLPFG